MRQGMPIATGMTKMSEKMINESKVGYRLYGWSVTSAANFGSLQTEKKSERSSTSMYSGRYLPACRIIHFGGRSTSSPRAARSNRSFSGVGHDCPSERRRSLAAKRCSRKSSGAGAMASRTASVAPTAQRARLRRRVPAAPMAAQKPAAAEKDSWEAELDQFLLEF